MTEVSDRRGRRLRDLRVSVTDRCNFRCTYCMPRDVFGPNHEFLPRDQLLTFEEITNLTRLFVARGVSKVRLTGGEPLLRRNIEDLVAMIAAVDGIEDLTMTTNGALLGRKAKSLAAAGLRRVTVSLDAIDDPTFMAMNDVGFPVATVLESIATAAHAGLGPVKVNCVVKRGVNEHAVLDMARHFKGTGHIVRFIEYMDVGSSNGWRMEDVVPAAEILDTIGRELPLVEVPPNYPGEVATRYRYADGSGEIGVIASVTRPFCGSCTRVRISAEGMLYTCLFASAGTDLRGAVRTGHDVGAVIDRVWTERTDRYSEVRARQARRRVPVEMSYIGG